MLVWKGGTCPGNLGFQSYVVVFVKYINFSNYIVQITVF